MQDAPSPVSRSFESLRPPPGIGETTQRLSEAELAIQSGTARSEIANFVELGLIRRPDATGTFDGGDVTRVRLIVALRDSGIGIDQLASGVTQRQLSFDFAGQVVADPASLTETTVEEACTELGLAYDSVHQLMLAIGFATPAKTALIRDDDLELLHIFTSVVGLGVSTEALTGTLRSFAISLRRLAEAARGLIREEVEEPLLARGMSYPEMFATVAKTRLSLQQFAYRVTFLFQRRLFEQAVYSNLIARFEEALDQHPFAAAKQLANRTVCFVDLSGFTERTEASGDVDAAHLAGSLIEIAQARATANHGDLIKSLGDGAMLLFTNASDAIRCALGIVVAAREVNLPATRAAITSGPMIAQDGDYFGRTVNLASRLLSIAAPHQVLITASVAASQRNRGFLFTEVGTFKLKGISEEVQVLSVADASAA